MDNSYSIIKSLKYKHVSNQNIEFIINQVIKFTASNHDRKRNIGKTLFIKQLATTVGTSVATIYRIIKDAKITITDTHLNDIEELSSSAIIGKRELRKSTPNNCKLDKAKPFIDMVIKEIKANKMASIDETINHLIIHCCEQIQGMETICTKTMYNYVEQGLVELKPIDLPRKLSRKPKKNYKTYISKRQKGTCITQRPFPMDDRSEFGHWEGDLVTGPRDGKNGAFLTLIERKTRAYMMIPISSKTSKNVYMSINKIHKFYGDDFSKIFKSITFDNGSEFARYKDIEKKPGEKQSRTTVYFGRPYRSSDRGSNENCNGLVRYFVKKGTVINKLSKEYIVDINKKINDKKRKILGYLPATDVFIEELKKLNVAKAEIFYVN